jgi:hypothetical protein
MARGSLKKAFCTSRIRRKRLQGFRLLGKFIFAIASASRPAFAHLVKGNIGRRSKSFGGFRASLGNKMKVFLTAKTFRHQHVPLTLGTVAKQYKEINLLCQGAVGFGGKMGSLGELFSATFTVSDTTKNERLLTKLFLIPCSLPFRHKKQ